MYSDSNHSMDISDDDVDDTVRSTTTLADAPPEFTNTLNIRKRKLRSQNFGQLQKSPQRQIKPSRTQVRRQKTNALKGNNKRGCMGVFREM